MDKMKSWIVFLVTLLIKANSAEAKTLEVNHKRLIEVIDVVDGSIIDDVAQALHKLSYDSKAPIWMLINSPGGSVGPGMTVLDAMTIAQSRGVKLKCISGVYAASMAFIILAHCDERYVLENTRLLFHPMSISVQGAPLKSLAPLVEKSLNTEEHINTFLKGKMGMSEKVYNLHYTAETVWTGRQLADETKRSNFVTVVKEVKGAAKLFVHRKPSIFQLLFGRQPIDYSVIRSLERLNEVDYITTENK